MSEVLVCLLLMEGAVRSCSSTWLGGAKWTKSRSGPRREI